MDMDGELFDPIDHFRTWEQKRREIALGLEKHALAGLRKAMEEIGPGWGRNRKIAAWLNQRGIRTSTGRPWTDDNVRHAIDTLA